MGRHINGQQTHTNNVVSISDFHPADFSRSTSEVENYWHQIRNGRLLPYRSDVDPRGIENSLEFAFIVERIAPGLARFRLTGSHLKELMGMDVRGMPLTSMFTADARKSVSDYIVRLFDGPEIISLTLTAQAGLRKPQMQAKMVLLPLKSDLGDVSRALGCIATEGKIGRTPRRFHIERANCRLITPQAVKDAIGIENTDVASAKSKKPDDIRPALTLLKFDN